MAVTQQLARLSDQLIAEAAMDAAVLEGICGYTALPAADYADLDWAPSLLEKAAARAAIDGDQAEALRRSTEGDAEVHPGYPLYVVAYSPVNYLSSLEVSKVGALLESIDISVLLCDDVVADVMEGAGADEPLAYLTEHFDKLREFYRESARRKLATVLWWN